MIISEVAPDLAVLIFSPDIQVPSTAADLRFASLAPTLSTTSYEKPPLSSRTQAII